MNDRFAALTKDLYLAERQAREEIKISSDMIGQRKVWEKEISEF